MFSVIYNIICTIKFCKYYTIYKEESFLKNKLTL